MLPAHLLISRERLKSKENSICHSKSRSKSNEDYSKQTTNEQKRKGYGSISSISRKSREGGSRSYSKSMEAYSKEKMKMSREKIKSGSGSCDLATARLLSKEKNSSGPKRSSTREGAFENSLEMEYYLEDKVRTKEMKKKSLKQTFLWFLFSIGFLCAGCFMQDRYAHLVHEDIIEFDYWFPSVTHYKMSILAKDFTTSNIILQMYTDIGSKNNYQREAAIYFSYWFVYNWKKHRRMKHIKYEEPLLEHPISVQTSLLAWGFDASSNNIGSLIVHQQNVTHWGKNTTSFDFGKSLTFSKMDNSSMFSKKIDTSFYALPYFDYANSTEGSYANGKKGPTKRQDNSFAPLKQMINESDTIDNYNFSSVDPRVNVSSLYSMSTVMIASLEFVSSGPKTLGTIAEIAIMAALKKLVRLKDFYGRDVNTAISEALACSLQALERHPGYFENLTLNLTKVRKDLKDRTNHYRKDLECVNEEPIVKLHTNGVETSSLLFMDNRGEWPTVFHYSVSTNGSVPLESSNGRKSTGLLNVCQVAVIKDGYLWLTAAASGEFYLLEKIVASIVYRITMDADPLEVLDFESRPRYDVRSATVVTGKYSSEEKRHVKEVLQFSEYKIHKNKFRSWVETPNRNADEEQTVASGY